MKPTETEQFYTVFADSNRVIRGNLAQVTQSVRVLTITNGTGTVLVFSDKTGQQIDIDLRINSVEIPEQLEKAEIIPQRRPGRPRLGVVGKEVTLLPRHWDWLNLQPGGASVTLRKLVEQARLGSRQKDIIRFSQEAAYRFMSAIAGNEEGYEEACRALFASNRKAFDENRQSWPPDVRTFASTLAAQAFGPE